MFGSNCIKKTSACNNGLILIEWIRKPLIIKASNLFYFIRFDLINSSVEKEIPNSFSRNSKYPLLISNSGQQILNHFHAFLNDHNE